MDTRAIHIFYRTTWDPALLHYTSLDAPQSDPWQDATFTPCTPLGLDEWHLVVLRDIQTGIKFVTCNFTKTQWDNPPSHSGNREYEARIDYSAPVNERQVFVLCNGEIFRVSGPRVMLVTDLDGTLLGDDEKLQRFNEHWIKHHIFRGSMLVYSTGRNLKDFLKVASEKKLLKPAYAICGVGTEVYEFLDHPSKSNSHIQDIDENLWRNEGLSLEHFDPNVQDKDLICPKWCPSRFHARLDPEWKKKISNQFNRLQAERHIKQLFKEAHINGSIYHDPYRVSVSVHISEIAGLSNDPIASLEACSEALAEYHLLLSGHSEWKYLDVLPKLGGKKHSVEYIARKCSIKNHEIMVCGDSGNDVDMFTIESANGCCVGNAQHDFVAALRQSRIDLSDPQQALNAKVTMFLLQRSQSKPISNINFSPYNSAGAILHSLGHFKFDKMSTIERLLN